MLDAAGVLFRHFAARPELYQRLGQHMVPFVDGVRLFVSLGGELYGDTLDFA